MGNKKCVGASHLNTFPYISPITLPTSFPHSPHTLSHTLPTLLHSPHIFSYLPHTPTHFPTSPSTPPISLPTAPLTSPYTPTHFLIHPMHSPTPLSPHLTSQFRLKIFYGNREFKVLFRCRQCKFSMYESVAKLLATLVGPTKHRSASFRLLCWDGQIPECKAPLISLSNFFPIKLLF